MRCLYESPAVACKQLRLYRHDSPQNLTSRAHNHRKGDEGRWYVVAGAEWPPYGHGLFFSDLDPMDRGETVETSWIRIGAMVYRGLGRAAAAGLTKPASRPLVMQRHWRWRDVVGEEDSELFVEPAVTAASALHSTLGLPVTIALGGGPVEPNAGVDPNDAIKRGWDRLVYTLDRTGAIEQVHTSGEQGLFTDLQGLSDIDEFAAALRKYAPDDWIWTEFCCFVRLQPAVEEQGRKAKSKRKADPGARLVTTHELYESMLTPFECWLFE